MAESNLEAVIAEQLRLVIARRGLSQAKAATLLGTSEKHLSQVLRQRAHPSINTLERWSELLGITWQVKARDI